MAQSILDDYAHLLTKDDALKLFQKLIDAYGNRNKASKACDLERKTTYNWTETQEMKIETKKKILNAFIDLFTEDAFKLLADKSVENSVEIIYFLLSSIFGQVVSEDVTSTEFSVLISKFNEVKTKYEGIIRQYLEYEVGDMETSFQINKPDDINLISIPPNFIRVSDLSELIPSLIKDVYIRVPNISNNQLAKNWDIPEQLINSISNGLHMIESEYRAALLERPMFKAHTIPPTAIPGTVSPYSQKDLNRLFSFQWQEEDQMVNRFG